MIYIEIRGDYSMNYDRIIPELMNRVSALEDKVRILKKEREAFRFIK